MFTIQTEMSFDNAISWCKKMQTMFETYQCPSACVDKIQMCYTPEFEACNLDCGNWYKCDCYVNRGQDGEPITCEGETVLPGWDGMPEDCFHFPEHCYNHLTTYCGTYKHCDPNFCIIKGTECPILDSCQSIGVCAPGDGKCYYATLPDGEGCDDDLFYTHTDRCQSAKCIGVEDKCERYSVQCSSTNPCLYPTPLVKDACDPPTGSCVFVAFPDGTACPSQPGMPPDGTCVAGLCRRDVLDKCAGKACPITDFCQGEAACNPDTGECEPSPKQEGEECDDGDSGTSNDVCIEGKCIGDVVSVPKFDYVAQESCDSAGAVDSSVGRYFGNVMHEDECKEQCLRDPWCVAYTYGYYACYIYGGQRQKDPEYAYWGKRWVLLHGTAQPVIEHGCICYKKADENALLEIFNQKGAWFAVTVTILVIIPGAWGLYMIWPAMSRSYKRLTGCFGGADEDKVQKPGKLALSKVIKAKKAEKELTLKVAPGEDYLDDDDNLRSASPRTDGAIAAHPDANLEDVDELKLNQASTPEEDAEPTDPRGQIQESNPVQDEAFQRNLQADFDNND